MVPSLVQSDDQGFESIVGAEKRKGPAPQIGVIIAQVYTL
jgi:hypothetical protein